MAQGDGLTFPPDNYDPSHQWGECDGCEWFPTVPRKQPGMKACVFDNSGDEIEGFGDFCAHPRPAQSYQPRCLMLCLMLCGMHEGLISAHAPILLHPTVCRFR